MDPKQHSGPCTETPHILPPQGWVKFNGHSHRSKVKGQGRYVKKTQFPDFGLGIPCTASHYGLWCDITAWDHVTSCDATEWCQLCERTHRTILAIKCPLPFHVSSGSNTIGPICLLYLTYVSIHHSTRTFGQKDSTWAPGHAGGVWMLRRFHF